MPDSVQAPLAALTEADRELPASTVVPQEESPARRRLMIAVLVFLGCVVIAITVPGLRWRLQVVYLDLTGRIPDLEIRELPALLMPGANQPRIARLVVTHNPYAVIHVPTDTAADVAAGAALFREQCASCHSPDGSGGPGAPTQNGREFRHGDTEWAVYRTIRDGVPGTAMAAHPLRRTDLWRLVAYIRLFGVPEDAVVAAKSTKLDHIRVSYADLVAAEEQGDDWLPYAGAYGSTRQSSLVQINTRNVGLLGVRWMHQLVGVRDKIETTPVVRDGVMYLTVPPGRIMA